MEMFSLVTTSNPLKAIHCFALSGYTSLIFLVLLKASNYFLIE